MDAGLPIRPAASPTQLGVARPESVPVREAARTDLPAAAAVTAADTGQAARNDAAARQAAQPLVDREIVVDDAAREVIFRTIDVRTGTVVRQVPDQALLRLRAYTRALLDGNKPGEAAIKSAADLVA